MHITKKDIRQTVFMLLANLFVALIINLLAWQFKLVSGGLTGYGIFFNLLTDVSVGTFLLLTNISLIILAYLFAGKFAGTRAVIGFTSFSLFIDGVRYILDLEQRAPLSFEYNLGIILVLSVCMGFAVSVILANEYSVGSYSTVYIIIKKYIDVKPEVVFFTLDAILALASAIQFGYDKGILLAINAVLAYFVVKAALPRLKKIF